jgi:acyl dehydratase
MEVLALDYAFGELGLEKLNCEVLSFNMPVVEFHRKYGFRIEGIFRAHYERDGERFDIYRLAQFRKSWLEWVRPTLQRARTSPPRFKAGLEHHTRIKVTRDLVRKYADVSSDRNVIHLDDAAARAAGFDGALAQGMLVAAGFSRILGTEFPGEGTVYVSQSLQFLRPVYPDIELEYGLRIVSVIGRRAFVSTKAFDAAGHEVLCGEAEIVLPPENS